MLQLQERSLQYASDILEKATKRVSEISNVTKHVDSSIITVAIQGTSNIMEAASDDVEIHELTAQTAKPVIQKLQRTMQDLLKVKYQSLLTLSSISITLIIRLAQNATGTTWTFERQFFRWKWQNKKSFLYGE